MNYMDQPEQQSYSQPSMTATSESWRALLSLSWYPSVPGRQLTLRYPGCQRHGSGAVQAYLRGQSLKEKIMNTKPTPTTEKTFACENCEMRNRSEANPKTLMAKLWRWHTRWCPGWKAYQAHLSDEQLKVSKGSSDQTEQGIAQ